MVSPVPIYTPPLTGLKDHFLHDRDCPFYQLNYSNRPHQVNTQLAMQRLEITGNRGTRSPTCLHTLVDYRMASELHPAYSKSLMLRAWLRRCLLGLSPILYSTLPGPFVDLVQHVKRAPGRAIEVS